MYIGGLPISRQNLPHKGVTVFQRLAHGFDIFTVIKLISILSSPDLDASKNDLKQNFSGGNGK